MIDLSFLTEEEQEAIMKVLQRDAELKRAEEERVRHLPEKVKDDVQLKNMSGQWFYEAKSKRHRDKIHGADIIRASMRRKPATLAEVSQNKSNKAKNSWVSNVNKEVFVPPELYGIVEHQEEEQQLKSSSSPSLYVICFFFAARLVSYYAFVQYLVAVESFTFVVCKLGAHVHDEWHQSSKTITSVLDKPEERPMKAAISPVKQRRNPFNSTASGDNVNSGESENRPATLPQLSKKELLSLSEESQSKPNLQNDETEKHKKPSVEPTDESQKGLVKRPVPKARKLIHKATDPVLQREDFVPKPAKRTERMNGIGIPPRGILKRSSSSSSTDSEVRVSQMLDVQKKNALPTATIFEGEAEKNSLMEEVEDSTQISLEKLKQVRFSSSTGRGEPLQSPQLHHGREKGEFDLLESDEIKSSGNDAIRSDSFGNKQISAVKPLGTYSSALQVKTIDGLQDDTSASGPCDTKRSVFLVNEALQTKTVTPKKLETPQKTSSNILPNSNNEPSVDETREYKANQFLSHESVSHKNSTDAHQLSAKTEAHEVSNTNSASLQQGKPDPVEERDAKTTFKPDKHADELMKVADESVSKVLDWFKRSSGSEDRKRVSASSQGREPKEEVDISTRTAVLPAEHSGPSMDGKTEIREELPFRKIKQRNSISPTSFISKDTQLLKERMKPKKGEKNEEQNDKLLTEFDCTRVEEKERGQEIKQQNQKSNLLEHQEHKLPAQKCESEKAIQEKRKIRKIRVFWERDKTIPSRGEKEVSINTDASGGSALKGLRESDKIKPTVVYPPNGLDDHSKNMLRSAELSCTSQASRNEYQNSKEFGLGHAVEKPERTLPSDGEVHDYTESPKASNLQPSVGATSASPESKDKDEKETLKGEVAACSQQKPSFQVLSLKEKMNEKSKNQNSDPLQFQRSPTLKGLNVTHTKNTDSVQLDRKPVISKLQGKMSLPEQEAKERVEKSDVSSKEHPLEGSHKAQAGLQNLLRETFAFQPSEYRRVGMKTSNDMNSISLTNCSVESTCQEDTGQPEEVNETTEKSVAPSKVSGLSSALEKLLKEASETPPPKPKRADRTVWGTADVEVKSTTYEHDGELPQEISETIEKSVAPSKDGGLSSALEKLLKEASETPPPKPKRADRTVWGTADVEVKSTTYEHDGELPQEISETIEKSVAPSKVGGLSSALEKLLKEASETPPPKPKRADRTVWGTADVEVKSTTYEHDGELPQEISETIEKSVAPSKVSGLSSALEKLLKEASETPPPKPKRADRTVWGTADVEVKSTTYEHDGELPQEISETIERSALSKAEYGVFDVNLQKLLKEVSETPASVLENMDKKMQGKIQTSQSMNASHQRERDHPQEIQETIEKTSVSNIAKFSEFSCSLEKLLQEASEVSCPISKELHKQGKFGDHMFPSQKETLFMTMSQPHNALSSYHTQMKIAMKGGAPEQNIKASVNDLAVSEIEASDLPKRNGAINKIEERNMAPVDSPPLERDTNMIAIKPFKINEKGRRDESTSLDASEKNSESKALSKFGRASTPLKDESNSPQPEGAQLCLMPQHEDNDEEGNSSNLGSKFSDENSDSHSGTGSSTRSEEELNPVLMALKRSADRKMPSKSLEDIPSATSNKGKINNPKEELALSAEDGLKPDQHQERNENAAGISTVPSKPNKLFSNPEKLKGLSKSVPSFLQEESDDRETDTASESSYSLGRIKKSPSSLTNLSSSSGMASLSSVSGSLMSIYSADFGNVDVKGSIQFTIDYVEQLNELHIFICQCKDLAVADVKRQRSDPYVKTYLLPEKYKLGKRKTSVKKKTLNPVYNEILRYKIEKGLLKNQSLNISVWHNDTFGRNSFLGEVELDLGTWDWNDKSNKQINWFPLKPRTSTMALELENRGEMKLALQYVPHPVGGKKTLSTGEVHIWVKECHDLPLLRGNRLNSFIKCTILPDTSRKSRQKTRTVAKTTNPVFNHTMVYDGFRPEDLKEACIELTVWDHNKLANHFLGGLRIGLGTGKSYGTTVDWMDSTSDETALWEKMMNSPNTWIEDTLPLRMLMVAKLTK
ncbi:PREDICTED: synaptotagmin-like protein 2 [Aptenodytes forsteri]|uniref:synaptotagmin-like protein 2 n=1 Tax=Aptenodytes forsteri TaxID=9233 RepID=UPI0009046188|nr:PREDICTED: synaptotagmin-like protein 2 [Aptenodytes forsteri]